MKTGFARVRSRVDAIDGIRVKNWHISRSQKFSAAVCLETSHKVCMRVNDHNRTATIQMFLKHNH